MSDELTPRSAAGSEAAVSSGGSVAASSDGALPAARRDGSRFRTGWARTPVANAVRDVVQVAGLGPIVRREVDLDVHGLEYVRELDGPALFVANHSSHLDTAVLLTTLPTERRRKTAVAAAADYFFDVWWRAAGSSIVFNTFPIERKGGSLSSTPADLIADGWSIVVYPEGTRSVDGVIGRFRMGGAWLAVHNQVPVIPVGLRGTYAAMPRGRGWPVDGRPRVSVRYGPPIVPRADETPREMQPKIVKAVRGLMAEDEATWWEVQRHGEDAVAKPPTARWARIWQQAAPPVAGGRKAPRKIWRG